MTPTKNLNGFTVSTICHTIFHVTWDRKQCKTKRIKTKVLACSRAWEKPIDASQKSDETRHEEEESKILTVGTCRRRMRENLTRNWVRFHFFVSNFVWTEMKFNWSPADFLFFLSFVASQFHLRQKISVFHSHTRIHLHTKLTNEIFFSKE